MGWIAVLGLMVTALTAIVSQATRMTRPKWWPSTRRSDRAVHFIKHNKGPSILVTLATGGFFIGVFGLRTQAARANREQAISDSLADVQRSKLDSVTAQNGVLLSSNSVLTSLQLADRRSKPVAYVYFLTDRTLPYQSQEWEELSDASKRPQRRPPGHGFIHRDLRTFLFPFVTQESAFHSKWTGMLVLPGVLWRTTVMIGRDGLLDAGPMAIGQKVDTITVGQSDSSVAITIEFGQAVDQLELLDALVMLYQKSIPALSLHVSGRADRESITSYYGRHLREVQVTYYLDEPCRFVVPLRLTSFRVLPESTGGATLNWRIAEAPRLEARLMADQPCREARPKASGVTARRDGRRR